MNSAGRDWGQEKGRTEEPGGLQSMGLQRVGHDLAAKQQQLSMQVTNSEECPEGNHSDTIAKYI